jgi:DNA topoisomerase-3
MYAGLTAANSGTMPGSRFVNDDKVSDHHAIIPTQIVPRNLPTDGPLARVYDIVCRHLLMIWHGAKVEAVTRLITEISTQDAEHDLYATQGTSIEARGWTVLEVAPQKARSEEPKLPGGLASGDAQAVTDVTVHRKTTRPPHAHTEATLLASMEFAGRNLATEDESVHEAMREFGLGTPATRAPTIETLLKRGYIERSGKTIISTATGRALIAAVSDQVKSAEMTGRWEQRLRSMEQGTDSLTGFMTDIAEYIRDVVTDEARKPCAPRRPHGAANSGPQPRKLRPRSQLRMRRAKAPAKGSSPGPHG